MLTYSKKEKYNSTIQQICETQAKIYVSAYKNGYDMEFFSSHYLKSEFCNREMDAKYSVWQYQDEDVCLEVIQHQIGYIADDSSQPLDIDAYWIGYMYRYLYYYTSCTSKELAEMIPFTKMVEFSYLLENHEYEEALQFIIQRLS